MKDMKKKAEMDAKSFGVKEDVLKELMEHMHDLMGKKFKGEMDSVTVAAKNPNDLGQGLEVAQDMLADADLPGPRENSDEIEEVEEEKGADIDNDQEKGESKEHKSEVFESDREKRDQKRKKKLFAMEEYE